MRWLVLLLLLPGAAWAQDVRTYDRTGAPTGTERRDALGSRTYDCTGRQVGSERRDPAGTSRFYDGSGRLEGSAR